jgi:hypothetical protein
MAKMNRRRIVSLRCDMRSASIALIFCTFLALGETAGAQQGYKFDVETYGGVVCDGVTDDTSAVQKTINAAAAMLQAGGSPGPIYFHRLFTRAIGGSARPFVIDSSKGNIPAGFDLRIL